MRNIAVYTLFDDEYFEYGVTMVYSFFRKNSWFDGDFIIINDDKWCILSDENKEKLKKISPYIKFFHIDSSKYSSIIDNQLKICPSINKKHLACFYKLEIFNNSYDKILWLDSDIITIDSIEELFNDGILDGKFCAALDYVFEEGYRLKKGGEDYFNGGVYRIDKTFKEIERYSYQRLCEFCSTVTKEDFEKVNRTKFKGLCVDQDCLNQYISDKDVILLPSLYNSNPSYKNLVSSKILHFYNPYKPNGVFDNPRSGKKYFFDLWREYRDKALKKVEQKQILYFYLWVSPDFENNMAVRVHEYCLKKYVKEFDELNFIVAIDDSRDLATIERALKWLNGICGKQRYNIRVVDNIAIRESRMILEDILPLIMNESDDMIFVGHSKGITDVNMEFRNKWSILRWVMGMYYYNLEILPYVKGVIDDYSMYGSFLTHFSNEYNSNVPNNHNTFYSGNFYWINPRKFKENMVYSNAFPDELMTRFLAENLPIAVKKKSLASYNNIVVENSVGGAYHMENEEWERVLRILGDGEKVFAYQNKILDDIFGGKSNEESIDIFIITHKNFETKRTNPIFKIVCSETDDVTSDKLKVIKVKPTLANDGWSEWQKIYEIYKGQAGPLKDYVGLCHYHRYIDFGNDVNRVPPMESLFDGADVSICNVVEVPSVRENYDVCHNVEDFDLCGEIIKEKFPEYAASFDMISHCDKLFAGNTLILRRDDFCNMCDFIFGVLLEYCKRVGIDPCSNESFHEYVNKNIEKYNKKHYIDDDSFKQQARIPAFLSERLLTIWVIGKCNKFRLFNMRED